jgi:O-antigen/teichoic acid export membrane protein
MTAVSPSVREHIVSGMRWTLWLAVLAIPFSYGTNILLARVGPEVIGTYGLISVYIGVVTAFLYLGGDPVAIKLMPAISPQDRLSFFVSYLIVIFIWLLPWLTIAALWPGLVHYIFGTRNGPYFDLFILCLAPVAILSSLTSASLRGLLDIRLAQFMMRAVPLGSFLCYALLYIWFRDLLTSHYTHAVWIIWFSLVVLTTTVGIRGLLISRQLTIVPFRFFLPKGFWSYVFATQQLGLLSFASQRLDYVLVLNLAGLDSLGKYVAVSALALTVPTINGYFVDTLLPSLTNLLAARNVVGASSAFTTHYRILLLVNTVTSCGLMLLADILIGVLGPKYTSLEPLVVVMALLAGLAAPGNLGSPLLYSVGKQQRRVWIDLLRVGLFIGLFVTLWPPLNLLGAVIASGSSQLIASILTLTLAKMSAPIQFSATRDYVKQAALLLLVAAAVLRFRPLPWSLAFIGWAGAASVFLVVARYSKGEFTAILRCFIPRA